MYTEEELLILSEKYKKYNIFTKIMHEMKDWKKVSSSTGYTIDGLPCGITLCCDEESVKEVCENIENPIIEDYDNRNP